MKKFLGFTLAEVMVTLGVLGALAAMTIPTLTYNYRSKLLETQFKTTYKDIQDIGIQYNNKYGDLGEYLKSKSNRNARTFASNFLSYIPGDYEYISNLSNVKATVNSDPTKKWFSRAYNDFIKGMSHTNGTHLFGNDKSDSYKSASLCDNGGAIWLDAKGRMWTFNLESNLICVDVNGGAAPNMWNVDMFVFAPMSAEQVARWVYNDTAENAKNYLSQFVLCDGDAIKRHPGASNNWLSDDDGNVIVTEEGTHVGGGCNSSFQPYRWGGENTDVAKLQQCNLNFCPFKYPVMNIAPQKDWEGKDRNNRLGEKVKPGDNYWKDYIQYK